MISIAAWLGLAGLYLALSGSFSLDEVVAGGLCSALGTLWVWRVRCCGEATQTVRIAHLRRMGAALLRLPAVTVSIGARLLRSAGGGSFPGVIRPATHREAAGCPFGDDPEAAGGRAVSVLAMSLAPDSYVVRIDRENCRILVHGVGPAEAL